MDAGLNVFRVPFLMERMVPGSMTGSIDSAYFQGYNNVRFSSGTVLQGIIR